MSAFADAEAEQAGGQTAQALGLDAPGSGQGGQIDRSARDKGVQTLQGKQIVPHGHSGLDDTGIGQKGGEPLVERLAGQLNEIDAIARGQLQQRGRRGFTLGENGAGFGIEP